MNLKSENEAMRLSHMQVSVNWKKTKKKQTSTPFKYFSIQSESWGRQDNERYYS